MKKPANDEGAQIIVNDITGRVVSSMNMTEKTVQVDLSNLPKGVYLLYVTSGDKRYTEKVVGSVSV